MCVRWVSSYLATALVISRFQVFFYSKFCNYLKEHFYTIDEEEDDNNEQEDSVAAVEHVSVETL